MGLLPRFQAARKQAVEDAQERPTDAPLVSNLRYPAGTLCSGSGPSDAIVLLTRSDLPVYVRVRLATATKQHPMGAAFREGQTSCAAASRMMMRQSRAWPDSSQSWASPSRA